MRLFLDTADVELIKKHAESGLVDGITTNPTLIMKSERDLKTVICEICKFIPGPVSSEGAGETAEQIVADGKEFSKWASNVVVKVPMTEQGLIAVRQLASMGIKTNVTLVFSVAQALLAAKAGATFVSPFVGRLDDIKQDGMALVSQIVQVYKNYGFKTEIIVASVRSVKHVQEAALAGAHIATVPPSIFSELYSHSLTDKGIEIFLQDYNKALKTKA